MYGPITIFGASFLWLMEDTIREFIGLNEMKEKQANQQKFQILAINES
jgi:hypothetical protein